MPPPTVLAQLLAGLGLGALAVQYTPHGFGCLDGPTVGLPMCDPALPTAARVANLVSLLTTEEKIGLTGSFNGDLCSDIDAGVPRLGIPNVTQLIEITGTVSSSCYVDAGNVSYCPTVFPAPLSLAASFSRELWRQKGAVTGIEARAFNNLHVPRIYNPLNYVDLIGFGPDLNLIMDPRNGRNGENPTEDPFLGGAFAVEVVRGIQEGEDPAYLQLAASLKHYTGYESETNRFAGNINITNFDLMDTLLPPYAAGLIAGRSVGTMCSYTSINGVPSCAHPWLLTALVRDFWGRPDATHVSDCGAIEDEFTAKGWASSYADATSRSINAGADACIGTAFIEEQGLANALSDGSLLMSSLDAALSRTLAVRFRLGMFDPPNSTIYTTYGPERINTHAAQTAAVTAAAQGAVLLRNEGGVLPFNASSPALTTIAVIGPHAVTQIDLLGDYYGDAFCPGLTTPQNKADGCVKTFGASVADYLVTAGRPDVNVLIAQGTNILGTESSGIAEALALAQMADVIILAVGYNNKDVEREGADHFFTTLPGLQTNLTDAVVSTAAARGVPVAMLLINAGQIALDSLAAQPPAIVEAFYPSFGAPAIVAQLFGATNAWGRLPYTMYPLAFASAINISDAAISTGVGRTYRYYNASFKGTGPALYSFGDGLSYTLFESTCSYGGGSGSDIGSAPGNASTSVPATSNFSLPVSCSTTLAPGEAMTGDEILLVFHRTGSDVAAAIGGAHPIPSSTLREFTRLSGVTSTGPPQASSFVLGPLDLALVNAAGASVLYPGTHFLDVSPRKPALPWTLTVTVTGSSPVVLSAPPPLPSAV